MSLKGSATIELINADGSKELIKHDNMITNAPADLLKSYRGEMPPLFKISSWRDSYAKAIFGGIFLFDDTLNDDANDYFFPSLNVIGYASQDAYAGTDISRGSYNATESGVQEDGSYKFVWDFATSQANGQIKALALCPNFMGKIGATETADSSNEFYKINERGITTGWITPFNTNGYMLPSSGETNGISNYDYFPVAVYGGYLYAIDYRNTVYNSSYSSRFITKNGGILKLYKFKCGLDTVSMADCIGGGTYVEAIDVTLPSDFVSGINASVITNYDYASGKLLVYNIALPSDFSPNTSIKYIEIDLSNMSVSSYTFTNNTTVTISANTTSSFVDEQSNPFYIFKDYIIAQGVSGSVRKLFTIKRSDNTIVKEVRYSDTHEFTFPTNYLITPFFENGKILVFKTMYASQVINKWYILDMETGIVKETNFTHYGRINAVDIGSKVCYGNSSTYLGFTTVLNPFVITTKNNLDSPVTKTASQTMKITYTLSEMQDSEV